MAARKAHNLKVGGSNPSPASKEKMSLFFLPDNLRVRPKHRRYPSAVFYYAEGNGMEIDVLGTKYKIEYRKREDDKNNAMDTWIVRSK